MNRKKAWQENGKGGMVHLKNRLYVKDLPCCEKAGKVTKHKQEIMKQHYFDFDLLPTQGQREEMRTFIVDCAERLSLSSIDGATLQYKIVARFMKERFPHTESFLQVEETELLIRLKAWMIKNGYKITCHHRTKERENGLIEEAQTIKFLKHLLRFLYPEEELPEEEKDIWVLDHFDFPIRQNPIGPIRTLKFGEIRQEGIRKEVKQACYIFLKYQSAGTIVSDIRAARRFADYLLDKYPKVQSFGEVGRKVIEGYLIHMKTEPSKRKNKKTELAHLKRILTQVGKNIEKPYLGKLFIKNDMPKMPEAVFRYYSDAEIERLNRHIVNLEEQVARALILHQMLGGRISDTLTLRTDCLYQEHGQYILRMYQVKTSYYEKPIPDYAAALIKKSMEYTFEKYGETEYIFVNEQNPKMPFQYSMLKHQVYVMIRENDIRNDEGELMGFGTHLFRHIYGVKLTELHLDDAAIAHLLGHRGVNTVYRYRRTSGQLLKEETKELRKTLDEILKDIVKEWDGYEQIFENG